MKHERYMSKAIFGNLLRSQQCPCRDIGKPAFLFPKTTITKDVCLFGMHEIFFRFCYIYITTHTLYKFALHTVYLTSRKNIKVNGSI